MSKPVGKAPAPTTASCPDVAGGGFGVAVGGASVAAMVAAWLGEGVEDGRGVADGAGVDVANGVGDGMSAATKVPSSPIAGLLSAGRPSLALSWIK